MGGPTMPVPTHFLFTFRGDFTSTPEHWSFGIRYRRDQPAGADAGIGDVDKDAVSTACDTFFGSSFGRIPNNVKMTDWRLYVIGTDGKAQGDIHVQDVSADSIQGADAPKYPPQVALAITKVSDDRGLARLGRFYLPTNAPLASDQRLSVSEATATHDAVVAFLKGISDAIDLPGFVNSSAAVNISSRGAGVLQEVDHLEVGRVLDTLRSRRRSMLEERVVGGQIDW
jgi:hypothetical protein